DADHHRIEMRLRSRRDQLVTLRGLDLQITFPRGREIRTEISVKFDRQLVTELLEASGFVCSHWYTDPAELFALSLARRGPDAG
ncbi:MAG: L-histidine N(alpha)-methyltransferase, partial [Candidatus Eiseniibacteriota bacterium]